ncbi:MAG TPA: helix-turn-helix transcriptional regulator [Acidimicrobiales bacterium]|jgi:MerR family transcriptional regulator/heat shock protein HspR
MAVLPTSGPGPDPRTGADNPRPDNPRADATRAVYVISVAAELAGVHPQTLRIYERKGLLDPRRTSGGSRRFSEGDLARLRYIQQLTTEGLNLEGVRRVLELEAEVAALRAELEQTRAAARAEVERTHRRYRRDLVPLDQSPVPYRAVRPVPRKR